MPWPKGVPLSEEIKAKISASRSGQKINRPSKRPVPPPLDPVVKRWVNYIWLALKKGSYIRRPRNGDKAHHSIPPNIGERTVVALASKLALVGTPDEAEAQLVFAALRVLFFQWRRLDPRRAKKNTFKHHVALLPQDRDGMLQVRDSVKASVLIPGNGIARETFSVENFLKVAVEIPVGAASDFVQFLLNDASRKEKKIRSIFHPKTLEYWKVRLRGIFSRDLASPEFREQVKRIKTIR